MNKSFSKVLKIVFYAAAVISLFAMIAVIVLSGMSEKNGDAFAQGHPALESFFSFIKTTPGYLCCIFVPFIILIISLGINAFLNIRLAGKAGSDDAPVPETASASGGFENVSGMSFSETVPSAGIRETGTKKPEGPSEFTMGFNFESSETKNSPSTENKEEEDVWAGLAMAVEAANNNNVETDVLEDQLVIEPEFVIMPGMEKETKTVTDDSQEFLLETMEFVLQPLEIAAEPEFEPEFEPVPVSGTESEPETEIPEEAPVVRTPEEEITVSEPDFETIPLTFEEPESEQADESEVMQEPETAGEEIPASENVTDWLSDTVIIDDVVPAEEPVYTDESEPVSDIDSDALAMLNEAVLGNTVPESADEPEPEVISETEAVPEQEPAPMPEIVPEPEIAAESGIDEQAESESAADWLNGAVIIDDDEPKEDAVPSEEPETEVITVPDEEPEPDIEEEVWAQPAAFAVPEEPETEEIPVPDKVPEPDIEEDVWAQLASVAAEESEPEEIPEPVENPESNAEDDVWAQLAAVVAEEPVTEDTAEPAAEIVTEEDIVNIAREIVDTASMPVQSDIEYPDEITGDDAEAAGTENREHPVMLSGSEFERRLWEGVDSVLAGRDLMQPDIISDVLTDDADIPVSDENADDLLSPAGDGELTDASRLFDSIDTIDSI